MLTLREIRSVRDLFRCMFRHTCRGESDVSPCRSGSSAAGTEGIRIFAPSDIGSLLKNAHRFVDEQGELTFIIAGCPLIAAPLVMFLLKREGLSRCRAWKDPQGLAVSALR